eukprot:g7737.t1
MGSGASKGSNDEAYLKYIEKLNSNEDLTVKNNAGPAAVEAGAGQPYAVESPPRGQGGGAPSTATGGAGKRRRPKHGAQHSLRRTASKGGQSFMKPLEKGSSDGFFKRMIEKYYSIQTDTTVAAPVPRAKGGAGEKGKKGGSSASECHWAAYSGDTSLLEQLLDSLDEAAVLDSLGRTPLFYAASQGHVDCCAFLLDHRHEWANLVDRKGDSSLHVAANYRHTSVVMLLLQTAADVTVRNSKGYTPLHVTDSSDSAKLLVEYGADVMSVCKKGRSPLFCASATNRLACAKYFCDLVTEYPRMVNLADHRGDTALHAACANGNAECVKILLEGVADVHAKNVRGLTPVEIALRNKHQDIVNLLKQDAIDSGNALSGTSKPAVPASPTARKALVQVYESPTPGTHKFGNISERDYTYQGHGESSAYSNYHGQHGSSTYGSAGSQGRGSTTVNMAMTERLASSHSDFNGFGAGGGADDDTLSRLQAIVNTPGRDVHGTTSSAPTNDDALARLQTIVNTPGRESAQQSGDAAEGNSLARLQAIVNTPGREVDEATPGDSLSRLHMVVNTPGRESGANGNDADVTGENDPLARLKSVVETPGRGAADDCSAANSESLWVEAVDPASGHVYYQNSVTGESQWEKPY